MATKEIKTEESMNFIFSKENLQFYLDGIDGNVMDFQLCSEPLVSFSTENIEEINNSNSEIPQSITCIKMIR